MNDVQPAKARKRQAVSHVSEHIPKEDSLIKLDYTNEEGVQAVEAKRQKKKCVHITMISTIPLILLTSVNCSSLSSFITAPYDDMMKM